MICVDDNQLNNEIGKSMMMDTNSVAGLVGGAMGRNSQIMVDDQFQEAEMAAAVHPDDVGQAQMMIVDESEAMDQQMIDDPNTHTISIPEGINLKPGESLVLLICENNSEEFIIINTAGEIHCS